MFKLTTSTMNKFTFYPAYILKLSKRAQSAPFTPEPTVTFQDRNLMYRDAALTIFLNTIKFQSNLY